MDRQLNTFQRIYKNPYLQFLIVGVLFALLPTLRAAGMVKAGTVTVIGTTLIYTIAALGLNILLGYSGLISLGTAGFMGLAAYCSAYFTEQLALPFWQSLILALLIPTVLGVIVGLLSMRFVGIYLGIATLAVGEILSEIFRQWDAFTRGTSGARAKYPKIFGMQLDQTGMYYLIVIITIIVFILVYQLLKGRLGRALNAMRGSEAAAMAMGISVYKYRLIAFGAATLLASLAGVLYVHYIRISYPTIWGLPLSLDFLAIIVIGGLRSIYGTLVGSFVIFAMSELVLKQIPYMENYSLVLKGVLIIIFILFYPYGLAHVVSDLRMRLGRRKTKVHPLAAKEEDIDG
ncbi:MAG TPA: branched-chain amino acid ABC transporter permease [Fastidiosipila sp.]|jgi:branched-chain amino acid transport system permease protein|nr:branched-chain amino acid ABC transporter permease [Fastidiosipila sp.]